MNIANTLELPVLVLNSNWQACDEKTVRRAFEDMLSGLEVAPFRGMDIELNLDGTLLYANPVDWDDWINLPVRPDDAWVYTGRQHIRAPRVIISTHFSKTHVKPVRLSPAAIKKRDKQQCQYCREFFPLDELNIDHVIPKFHGGGDSWTNMVCSCKPCNTKKGHKHNSEIGYKLMHEPKEPCPLPTTFMYQAKHPSWVPFLPHKK